MTTILLTLGVAAATLVGLMIAMQLVVRLRARSIAGKPVPALTGPTGKRIAKARSALVYFFSPGCAACRPLTPKMKAMSERRSDVFLVDVSQSFEIARALKVMATPSTVEIADGTIVALHIGPVPAEVLARFS